MSNTNDDNALDLLEIEERRAAARAKAVTASTPLTLHSPKRYRVTIFGMAHFESYESPKVSPLVKWILTKLGIEFSVQE